MTAHKTSLGILAGILAGSLWGLVFLAPELTRGFSPLQLSAGRYLAYGAISALLLAPSWRRLRERLSMREWRALAWLSLAGNIVYYVFLAQAVQRGGVAMTSIVIGLLPLAVTLAGSGERHAVPLPRLLPSLLLGAGGLACIAWESLQGHESGSLPGSLTGLLCALGALVSWTIYALANSRILARLHSVTPHEWSLLTGLVTGAEALLLALPAFLGGTSHASGDWLDFIGIVSSVALLCSVIGNGLWNYASRALPLALMGQMIVFETLFAAFYGFLWEGRWPTAAESLALALLIAGVVSCASVYRERKLAVGAGGGVPAGSSMK